MRTRATVLFITLVAMSCSLAAFSAGQAAADPAGTVHFVRQADSSFDQYSGSGSASTEAWIRDHAWRMSVWSPYFDNKTGWYPNGWVYDDSYAIYTDGQLATQHPEWILKDASGHDLYIPFACSGGTCPQYAADISNPAYRQYWINNLKAELTHGYKGVFVDDVNMDMQVGNGNGDLVAPIDPSTGHPMTADAWRHYMAEFMAEIRAALPSNFEIVHNVIWYAGNHAGTANADIRQEISSANYIDLERGVNDSGLTGGTGQWSVNALLNFVDQVHALGKGVLMDGGATAAPGLEYNLAAYFLISTGNDGVSGAGQTPNNWWSGYDTNLGNALTGRYSWNGLLRRDFSGGMALLNPPGAPTTTVTLPEPMVDVAGHTVTAVTLSAASGAVLRGDAPTLGASHARRSGARTRTTIQRIAVRKRAAAPVLARAAYTHGVASAPAAGGRRITVHLRGRVFTATAGKVTMQVQVRRNGRWVILKRSTHALTRRGFFSFAFTVRSARYRVRAVYRGAAGFRPSQSKFRAVAAKSRPHAPK